MISILRAGFRGGVFLGVCAVMGADYLLRTRWQKAKPYQARAQWTQRCAKAMLWSMGAKVRFEGTFPERGLLTCNHVSYLDIPVLVSIHPMIFVSKSEVRKWPIIGWLTQCAGTIYIVREEKREVTRVPKQFGPVLDEGLVVGIFPEGTSSDGTTVLPFRSALLEPAAQAGWEVTPGWISYEVEGGDSKVDAAYWGDMTFFPHLLKLFGKPQVRATVRFGQKLPPGLDRKAMAKELRDQILQISS